MHTQEKAPSQSMRVLEYLKQHGTITTLDARRMGIMHPGMRVRELRKNGNKIDTAKTYQADESGTVHRVACYVWRGQQAMQGDLWSGA